MTIEQLQRRLRGALITAIRPPERSKTRTGPDASGQGRKSTTLIVRAANVGDAQAAIRFANRAGLSFRVRGCPRSAGTQTTGADMIIDISALRGIAVDSANRIARVEPYATTGDLAAALSRKGLRFPHPAQSVPIGAILLDRGAGMASRAAQSRVTAFEAVRNDGSLVTIPTHEGHAIDRDAMFPDIALVAAFRVRLDPVEQTAFSRDVSPGGMGAIPA